MGDIKDHGYAWVALAATWFLNVIFSASYSISGIFTVEFLTYFRTDKTTITWIGACNMLFGNLASAATGPLFKKFGCRPILGGSAIVLCISYVLSGWLATLPVLYIFFGTISGIAFLFIHVGGFICVQLWFDKRRSLASGIFMAGQSGGIFIWPPLTRWLIDLYCWQGALIVLAAIFLNTTVAAALIRKAPESKNTTNEREEISVTNTTTTLCKENSSKVRLFFPYAVLLIGVLLHQMAHVNMFAFTPLRAKHLNIPDEQSPLLISVIGMVGLIARPTAGWIGDRKKVNRTIMFGLSMIFAGILAIVSTQMKHFSSLLIISIAFGIFSAGYASVMGPVVVDVAGLDNVEIASGLLIATSGVSNFFMHFIGGRILDLTGNTKILFWLVGSLEVLGGSLILFVPLIQSSCIKASQREELDHKKPENLVDEEQL